MRLTIDRALLEFPVVHMSPDKDPWLRWRNRMKTYDIMVKAPGLVLSYSLCIYRPKKTSHILDIQACKRILLHCKIWNIRKINAKLTNSDVVGTLYQRTVETPCSEVIPCDIKTILYWWLSEHKEIFKACIHSMFFLVIASRIVTEISKRLYFRQAMVESATPQHICLITRALRLWQWNNLHINVI